LGASRSYDSKCVKNDWLIDSAGNAMEVENACKLLRPLSFTARFQYTAMCTGVLLLYRISNFDNNRTSTKPITWCKIQQYVEEKKSVVVVLGLDACS